MTDETFIEQIAEVRASQLVITFILFSILENQGCNPEVLLRAVDGLSRGTADSIEARLRKEAGLEPREQPRKSLVDQVLNEQPFTLIDWTKMMQN